ncbi:hypothetical protein OUZ56_019261 [Daphnia magna]|uniref:Uncharacterized protein n=1 Tax=Daphnia magna TaxID=35525 RepID=A0ABQ9ZB31_9CRUS|nr:hypothetical protein OUZ56_019261 [Daphnia magna]
MSRVYWRLHINEIAVGSTRGAVGTLETVAHQVAVDSRGITHKIHYARVVTTQQKIVVDFRFAQIKFVPSSPLEYEAVHHGLGVFVIMANVLSRIPTTMVPAGLRLAQKTNATVATSNHQTLKVAVINRSHVGLAGEWEKVALKQQEVFFTMSCVLDRCISPLDI